MCLSVNHRVGGGILHELGERALSVLMTQTVKVKWEMSHWGLTAPSEFKLVSG